MRKLVFVLFMFVCHPSFGQFFEDFSKDLRYWNGDTSSFHISEYGLLQLQSGSAGEAIIYRFIDQMDTLVWKGLSILDFPPSNSNQVEIWLIADSLNLNNGLFFRLGESGSMDSLRVYQRIDGTDQELVAMYLPSFSTRRVEFQYELSIDEENVRFELESEGHSVEHEWQMDLQNEHFYFAIKCMFTATRTDKFYFDDIAVGRIPEDSTPPHITNIEAIDSQRLMVLFSEPLDSTKNPSLTLTPDPGIQGIRASWDIGLWEVDLKSPLESGRRYEVTLGSVGDLAGNVVDSLKTSVRYIRIAMPGEHDIVITEIMPDPSPARALPECEFVELFNRTDKFFNLSEMTLADRSQQVFLPDSLIHPGEYVILCDEDCILDFTPFGRVIGVESFPNFNNDGDDVSLVDFAGRIIHGFTYDKNWYRDKDREEGGWSLEMIHPEAVCHGQGNWRAADYRRCGSPGKINTVFDENILAGMLRLDRVIATGPHRLESTFDRRLSDDMDSISVHCQPSLEISGITIDDNILKIDLLDSLETGRGYEVFIENVFDCLGDMHSGPYVDTVFLPRKVDSGDVVINEVLFDPNAGSADFVEIKNTTDEYLILTRFCIESRTRNDTSFECHDGQLIIEPQSHIALSADTLALSQEYQTGQLFYFDLPSLPDEWAEIELFEYHFGWRDVLDQSQYIDDWHSPVLSETDGVSLEKLDDRSDGMDRHNWHSASSSVGFATPGLSNSVIRTGIPESDEMISLSTDAFSPNGDGYKDWLEISISAKKPGFNLRMDVFTANGQYVGRMANNDLLGTEQTIMWDGTGKDGRLQPIGLYLILAELAHPDGEIHRQKVSVVLN